jgi:hypothetical protein
MTDTEQTDVARLEQKDKLLEEIRRDIAETKPTSSPTGLFRQHCVDLLSRLEQCEADTWKRAIEIVDQHFHASETNDSRWNAAVLSITHYLKDAAAALGKKPAPPRSEE